MDKSLEENVNLRRKIVFLKEQVKEKEHFINLLEEVLNKENKILGIACLDENFKIKPKVVFNAIG